MRYRKFWRHSEVSFWSVAWILLLGPSHGGKKRSWNDSESKAFILLQFLTRLLANHQPFAAYLTTLLLMGTASVLLIQQLV